MVAKYIQSGSGIKSGNTSRSTDGEQQQKEKKNGALLHTTWPRIKANRPENEKKGGAFFVFVVLKRIAEEQRNKQAKNNNNKKKRCRFFFVFIFAA